MTMIYILAILFVSLFVLVKILENSKMRISEESSSKLSRWFMPLVGVLLVVQLVMMMFRD